MTPEVYKRIQNCAETLRMLCAASGMDQEADQADAIRESAIICESDFYELNGAIVEKKGFK